MHFAFLFLSERFLSCLATDNTIKKILESFQVNKKGHCLSLFLYDFGSVFATLINPIFKLKNFVKQNCRRLISIIVCEFYVLLSFKYCETYERNSMLFWNWQSRKLNTSGRKVSHKGSIQNKQKWRREKIFLRLTSLLP